MKTILKWPGGKEKELPVIREFTPEYSGRFVEPFVGGGAVFFDTDNSRTCFINDKASELINLYHCIQNRNEDLINHLNLECKEFYSLGDLVDNNTEEILDLYNERISIDDFISKHAEYFGSLAEGYNSVFMKELKKNLTSKIKRAHKLEAENGGIPNSDRCDNIEAAIKSAYYMFVRYLQNHLSELSVGRQAAVFFFIREYTYSSMFRYNSKGEFNVPYGGISYNRKDFKKKIDYMLSDEMYEKLKDTTIHCDDFESFMNGLNLTENDFVFLDPPYDSDFSTYANNVFGQDEQIRLCECLKRTKAKILLVIKNTEFIYNLYNDDFKISSFDKKYMVSFMNRNEKDVKHLVITNY
ncbi:MAG: DNA adenine methylase [Oscillospiraceae bacterium]|nr:DNA adenine methylase [Oscillospiraceae bacterium]